MYADIKLAREVYGTEDHEMVRQTMIDFINKEVIPYHDGWEKQGHVSYELWKKAGELGLLCIDMPVEYGGSGLDFSFSAMFMEELAKRGCTGPGFFLHSDIVAPYILKYATEAQKQKYLTKMCSGESIAAIGMTEPSCGSDLQALQTKAVDMGDHYLVNGSKTFITNGYMCHFAIVAVKTNSGTPSEGISLLFMDADSEGFTKGKPFEKMGMKANDTCELFFEDVKVPKENLMGEEGQGFIYMMTELARERLVVALSAIGGAEGALEDTIAYTLERRAFKQPIAGFQNTQFKLAELATQLQIHQAFVDRCIALCAKHKLTPELGSMAKYTASEMHWKLADECVQLYGGYGYIWEYSISRQLADSRVARIYAGTNEIMKLLIARGLLKEYFAEVRRKRKAELTEV
jgi:acyl-CoA dehydrogenase